MKKEWFFNDIHIPTRAKYFPTKQFLFVLSFVKGYVQLSFEKMTKMIFYPHYLLASPRNNGVHNSIPQYVSTAIISTVMTMTFPVKPFEKKVFEEVIFSSNIIKTPRSSRDGAKKKREKKY
jgi:hypothetical protein